MNDGERLKRLIESTPGCSQAKLARAAGVNRTAVNHWTKEEKFTLKMWANIRSGLLKLGLDPRAVRVDEETPRENEESLIPLIQGWTDDQLSILRRILDAGEDGQDRIMAFLIGALRHRTQ